MFTLGAASITAHGVELRKARAYHALGRALSAQGKRASAAAAHRSGAEREHSPGGVAALASALVASGAVDEARAVLIGARATDGGARRAIDAAERLAAAGEEDAARGLLRWGLLSGGAALLAPVPEYQWPKPPDLAWAKAAPYASALGARTTDEKANEERG